MSKTVDELVDAWNEYVAAWNETQQLSASFNQVLLQANEEGLSAYKVSKLLGLNGKSVRDRLLRARAERNEANDA